MFRIEFSSWENGTPRIVEEITGIVSESRGIALLKATGPICCVHDAMGGRLIEVERDMLRATFNSHAGQMWIRRYHEDGTTGGRIDVA